MMEKEWKALKLIRNIKDPKLRAELRKDLMKLVELKAERDKAERDKENKIYKYHDKYRSTKLH
jgi:hypothetical protein